MIRLGSPCLHIRSEGGDNLWHYCLKIVQRFPLNKNILGVAFLSPPKKKNDSLGKEQKSLKVKPILHSAEFSNVFVRRALESPGNPAKVEASPWCRTTSMVWTWGMQCSIHQNCCFTTSRSRYWWYTIFRQTQINWFDITVPEKTAGRGGAGYSSVPIEPEIYPI